MYIFYIGMLDSVHFQKELAHSKQLIESRQEKKRICQYCFIDKTFLNKLLKQQSSKRYQAKQVIPFF